ncbi:MULTISPECIES: hypothetical protein [unclassified Nodularia (in: cyanobacteria)]|uniref:hypothetical protein n=1 Tax=unclassified Nodularia (in: cyanobacteria) TaxID=2656917 RepID=UPI00187F9342|nr:MULTISPECIES: hypothetical protein [unclassified Nodularia (in: cyanobacteria)]MBE9197636.1 hypothetical protein [Nodularia sp. LEGE 06071]MCC2692142.1 hypothetical protein [Nodularia sp. LEGE 04288]
MAENSIEGNGNWYYTDGQWISDEGADLSVADAFASGNPPDGYIPDNISDATSFGDSSGGNPFGDGGDSSGGSPFAGGNPFMSGDGGNVSTTSEDGQYSYNYTRTEDERSLAPDDNNPFGQLIDILSLDSNSSDSGSNSFDGGNDLAGNLPIGSTPASSTNENVLPEAPEGISVPYNSDNLTVEMNDLESGELGISNSDNTGNGNGNSFGGGNDLAGNLPIGSTPASSTNGNVLPEAPEGISVPYNSDNWISDLKDLESGETGASTEGNTGNGNGNWFYGSNNTADGNGNWYFGSGNTTDGNGNWQLGDNNTADGNGNWEFGSGNTSDGNGNWQLGDNNTVNGNANIPSGDGNNINGNSNILSGNSSNVLGNTNTSNINNGSLLGNSIEATDDGKAYIGNEDWSFDILDELTSLGSGVSGVGSDVNSLLSHPDIVSTTTSKEGFTDSPFLANSDYQFEFSGV